MPETEQASDHVLIVGDLIDDIVVVPTAAIRVDTDTVSSIRQVPGGSAANTAAWLGSMGVSVILAACVGVDDLARCTAELEAHGVTPRLTTSEAPTGAIVVLVEGDNRSMLTSRGANADLRLGEVTNFGRHLHVTGHTLAAADPSEFHDLITRAVASGASVSVCPGSSAYIDDLGAEAFLGAIAGATVLIASIGEGRALTGRTEAVDVEAALLAHYPTVVLTLGSNGVLVDGVHVPAITAQSADPTGAGDAFTAGFLAEWLQTGDLVAAAQRGTQIAATAVARVGGRPPHSAR